MNFVNWTNALDWSNVGSLFKCKVVSNGCSIYLSWIYVSITAIVSLFSSKKCDLNDVWEMEMVLDDVNSALKVD